MSLKAKLEAVIYAAEEPVTLGQLTNLFAGEAFAWAAERAAEQAPPLPLEETSTEAVAEPPAESLTDAPSDSAADGPVEPDGELNLDTTSLDTAGLDAASLDGASLDAASESVAAGVLHAVSHAAEPAVAERQAAVEEPQPDAAQVNVEANVGFKAEFKAEEAELEARRQERRREREAREILREILDELVADYAADVRGLEIREIAGGFRMGTKPEMHDAVRSFVKSLKPPMKLSLPALETLAVIAYKQPVTAPEVAEIRGVDSAGVLGSLISRKLIATAGRKQVIGRPMLYKTTKEFLLRFGLKDLNELPSMEEFEKMAALELSEDAVDEAAAQTGDLFSESESATVPDAGGAEDETAVPEDDLPSPENNETSPETAEAGPAEAATMEDETGTVHTAGLPSEETTEAIVERQAAEETEVQP